MSLTLLRIMSFRRCIADVVVGDYALSPAVVGCGAAVVDSTGADHRHS